MTNKRKFTKEEKLQIKKEIQVIIEKATAEADIQITKSLYNKAKGGDTTAIIFWLKNRLPSIWRDKQDIEHSGSVGVTYQISEKFMPKEGKGKKN